MNFRSGEGVESQRLSLEKVALSIGEEDGPEARQTGLVMESLIILDDLAKSNYRVFGVQIPNWKQVCQLSKMGGKETLGHYGGCNSSKVIVFFFSKQAKHFGSQITRFFPRGVTHNPVSRQC